MKCPILTNKRHYDLSRANRMKLRPVAAALIIWVICIIAARCQDWKQIHRDDDAKWAHITGLGAEEVHSLWRMSSRFADENDDDSRIDQLNLDALSARKQILLVTSAGTKDCITISVFQRVSPVAFRKMWTGEQTPESRGFCATRFGRAEVDVWDGVIHVMIPEGRSTKDPSSQSIVVYQYGWKGGAYEYLGTKRMYRSSIKSSKTQ